MSALDHLVDWRALARVVASLEPSRYGAPGYPALLLLKGVLLQQWYGLSDPGLEDALADRLSFRRFVGLPLDAAVPDHTTICRFRGALREAGLAEAVFTEINRQIDDKGLILRRGTLIDATLAPANVKRPAKPKTEAAASEAAESKPASANQTGRSTTDPDAEWTKKNGKAHFGYKGHVGVDEGSGSGIIRRAKLTGASVNDTVVADELIPGDERAVYGDQAYSTHARRASLRKPPQNRPAQATGHPKPTGSHRMRVADLKNSTPAFTSALTLRIPQRSPAGRGQGEGAAPPHQGKPRSRCGSPSP